MWSPVPSTRKLDEFLHSLDPKATVTSSQYQRFAKRDTETTANDDIDQLAEQIDRAWDSVAGSKSPKTTDLEMLFEGAQLSQTTLSVSAAQALGEAAEYCDQAKDMIARLSHSSKAAGRWSAIHALRFISDTKFRERIVVERLQDRSARVREVATSVILEADMEQLLPDLNIAISHEENTQTKHGMVFAESLVSCRYHIEEPFDDGMVYVTFRLPDGMIVSTPADAESVSKHGIQRLIPGLAREVGAEIHQRSKRP